jgi:hypothetical protein
VGGNPLYLIAAVVFFIVALVMRKNKPVAIGCTLLGVLGVVAMLMVW